MKGIVVNKKCKINVCSSDYVFDLEGELINVPSKERDLLHIKMNFF